MPFKDTADFNNSFQKVTSGILILELIVLMLAIPVVYPNGKLAISFLISLIGLVLSGFVLQGKKIAKTYNLTLQLLVILMGYFSLAMFSLGIVFLIVWLIVYGMARQVEEFQNQLKNE